MRIWQRGTSFSGISGIIYTADRWNNYLNYGTYSQNTDVPTGSGFQYSMDLSNSTTSYCTLQQRIESYNIYDLAGKTATLSFWAKNVSGSAALNIEYACPSATDNYSSITDATDILISSNPSSTWTYYTYTFTVPANATKGLYIMPFRSQNSSSETRYTGVQLEAGSNASGFEFLPIDVELARCYRYYETNYPISLPPGSNLSSSYDSSTLMFCTVVNGGTTGSNRARSANTVLKVSKRTSSPSTRYWDYVGNLTKFTGLDNNGGVATNNVSVDTYGGVFSDGQTVYFQTVTGNASYYYGGAMWEVNSEL